jgi:curved DNA-binding protein CbpA
MVDYYKILGLNSNAKDAEIKAAYRKLSKKFHPDMNDGDKFFEDRFREIQEAYEKLCDQEYRNAYSNFKDESYKKTESTKNYNKSKQEKSNNDVNKAQPVPKPSRFLQNVLFTVIIIIIIGVIKVALQESVRKNALENIENTYTPSSGYESSSDLSNSKNLNVGNLDSIPVYSPPDSTAQASTIEENMTSKVETQKWILEKLNNYSTNYTSCSSMDVISYGTPINCTTYSNYSFIFKGDYLEVRYTNDDRRNDLVKIPLYDFSSILNKYSSITIFTNESTMIEIHSDDNYKEVSSVVTIGLKTETETDLVKRLEKAFKHLSSFYSKPKSNEAF